MTFTGKIHLLIHPVVGYPAITLREVADIDEAQKLGFHAAGDVESHDAIGGLGPAYGRPGGYCPGGYSKPRYGGRVLARLGRDRPMQGLSLISVLQDEEGWCLPETRE